MFNRHGHHVEEDDEHDEDVKVLTRCDLEEDQLTFYLGGGGGGERGVEGGGGEGSKRGRGG